MTDILNEGMRGGDLEDLILPMISVDEYESKVDDDAVVIAFYVSEHGGAEDLNRFLQRSPVELIDTEISPAPDAQGYYMVFVELMKNNTLGQNITDILEEVAPLAKIDAWKMQLRGHDDLVPFSSEEIEKTVVNPEEDDLSESIIKFLQPSDLNDARVDRGQLYMSGGYQNLEAEVVGFGELSAVLAQQGLNETAISMSLDDVTHCRNITTILGSGWSVQRMSGIDILQHDGSESVLALRL
jgi:hypothetical protein